MADQNPPPPGLDLNSAVLVQLGELKEGQRNTLDGVNRIEATLNSHADRIGATEAKVAVLETRVETIAKTQDESEQDAKPMKGRWANWISAAVATAAFVLFILDRLYATSH